MRQLAERLPFATLEDLRNAHAPDRRFSLTLGVLLGVAGFLPLSPVEAHLISLDPNSLADVERAWHSFGSARHTDHLHGAHPVFDQHAGQVSAAGEIVGNASEYRSHGGITGQGCWGQLPAAFLAAGS